MIVSRTWRMILYTAVRAAGVLCMLVITVGEVVTKPHVVFVMIDDGGVGDVGYNSQLVGPRDGKTVEERSGKVLTPFIDQLVSESIKLTNFYGEPLCTPSRVALLTGRYPYRTGLTYPCSSYPLGLPADEVLLVQYFKEQGYATHGVGKWHIGRSYNYEIPTSRGFDSWKGNLDGCLDYFKYHITCTPDPSFHLYDFSSMSHEGDTFALLPRSKEPAQYVTDVYSQAALDIIEQHISESNRSVKDDSEQMEKEEQHGEEEVRPAPEQADGVKPLFLYLSYTAVHLPLQSPPESTGDVAACQPSSLGFSENDVINDLERVNQRVKLCSMIKAIDRGVQEVVKALDAYGMWEDTLFILASDNGGVPPPVSGSDNGGFRGIKTEVFEGGIRTPAFIRVGSNLISDDALSSRTPVESGGQKITLSAVRGIEYTGIVHISDLLVTALGRTPSEKAEKTKEIEKSDGSSRYDDSTTSSSSFSLSGRSEKLLDGIDLWESLTSYGKAGQKRTKLVINALPPGTPYSSSTPFRPGKHFGYQHTASIAQLEDGKTWKYAYQYDEEHLFNLSDDPGETTNLWDNGSYASQQAVLVALQEAANEESVMMDDSITWLDAYAQQLQLPPTNLSPEKAAERAEFILEGYQCAVPMDRPEFLISDCSLLLSDDEYDSWQQQERVEGGRI